ncbi:unnamed protein product, partial [Ectocarpus sp. 13 AM-2016]
TPTAARSERACVFDSKRTAAYGVEYICVPLSPSRLSPSSGPLAPRMVALPSLPPRTHAEVTPYHEANRKVSG